MRPWIAALFLASTAALAGARKAPDPTKPIPWFHRASPSKVDTAGGAQPRPVTALTLPQACPELRFA
ncbi:MAG: hypothetical protein R3B70_40785 [Polyangiaceae bacterium]